jgi:hypothetical protein
MAEKTETPEEREERQRRVAAGLQETEVPTAERGTETYAAGTSQAAGGYATRGTMKQGPKVEKPKESGVKSITEKAGGAAATGMPTQDNWQEKFPDASSFFDAVRLWREGKRGEAADQKAAIAKARKANK